jgi:transposase
MSELTDHYRLLLGLDEAWRVDSVDLLPSEKAVTIRLEHLGGALRCPECDGVCSRADTAEERTWRHLDTMRFRTEIRARAPRSNCPDCGMLTVRVPWAGKHSRFTLLFEAFTIDVLKACANVSRAAELLELSWKAVHGIIERAVERGLARRSLEEVHHVGLDEKSFGKGHDYISVMTDIEGHRVLEVAEGRTIESADTLWKTLSKEQRGKVTAIAMDLWQAFISSTRKNAPEAEIVHDKFHVSKYLNDAVDKVRRSENNELRNADDDRLAGSRYLWLFNPKNMSDDRLTQLERVRQHDLKTSRAWAIKENFRRFWNYIYPDSAEGFFDRWYAWAIRSRLTPIRTVAKRLKRHLPELLSYFRHPITNAMAEGFNSRIQSIKSAARGFRNFANYRLRILFYCGKLNIQPD